MSIPPYLNDGPTVSCKLFTLIFLAQKAQKERILHHNITSWKLSIYYQYCLTDWCLYVQFEQQQKIVHRSGCDVRLKLGWSKTWFQDKVKVVHILMLYLHTAPKNGWFIDTFLGRRLLCQKILLILKVFHFRPMMLETKLRFSQFELFFLQIIENCATEMYL